MPDATEWLVEHDIPEDAVTQFEHIAKFEDAVEYLRQLVGQGRVGTLYQRVPFTTRVDVTVQARRTRKKKESTERAATPRAEEPPTKDAAAQEPAPSPVVGSAEPTASPVSPDAGGIDPSPADSLAFAGSNPAPATSLFVCEASFPSDAACPGPAEFDPVTRGRFCGFHLVQVPEEHRREMHRIHGHRNRPHEAMVRLVG